MKETRRAQAYHFVSMALAACMIVLTACHTPARTTLTLSVAASLKDEIAEVERLTGTITRRWTFAITLALREHWPSDRGGRTGGWFLSALRQTDERVRSKGLIAAGKGVHRIYRRIFPRKDGVLLSAQTQPWRVQLDRRGC